MDDIVKAAMNKWPNVPHCYGWLALDARGQWRMRDERCQQLNQPGDIIRHPALIDFINRNYTVDEQGCWYFQNGPQRVYVDLEVAPYICRYSPKDVQLHVQQILTDVEEVVFDDSYRLFILSKQKICLVDDRDIELSLQNIKKQFSPLSIEDLMTWLESGCSETLSIDVPGIQRTLPLNKSTYDELKLRFPLNLKPRAFNRP